MLHLYVLCFVITYTCILSKANGNTDLKHIDLVKEETSTNV